MELIRLIQKVYIASIKTPPTLKSKKLNYFQEELLIYMKKYDEKDLYEVFKLVSTPNISDALHRAPCMRDIHPIFPGIKMVGKAVTVRAYNGDWSKPVEAIDIAGKGDVIVIEEDGDIAVWGELASHSCQVRGIEGVVIDGAIRDVDDIRELKYPAFAKYIRSNAGDPKGFGEINIEIEAGGLKVRPGDWIVGDDNGVIVIPKEKAQEMANRALMVLENENRIREEIKRGSTLAKVLKLKKWEKVIG